jgi:ribosomal protein L44E
MRCPDCEKFVPFEPGDPEISGEEVDNGTVTGQVRIVLTCGECGTELKEANLDFDMAFEHECEKVKEDEEPEFDEPVLEAENVDDYRPKVDEKGKPVPSRFQKHYYGAEITGTVKCKTCGEEIELDAVTVDEQSSAMDDC